MQGFIEKDHNLTKTFAMHIKLYCILGYRVEMEMNEDMEQCRNQICSREHLQFCRNEHFAGLLEYHETALVADHVVHIPAEFVVEVLQRAGEVMRRHAFNHLLQVHSNVDLLPLLVA